MLLYCIRHGETTYNAEGRIQGQHDTQLSPLGQKQSEAIARALCEAGIQAVFASPLTRAFETARPLAAACRVELQVDDRLKELNAGVFQTLLPNEMAERYPAETARWKSHDPDFQIPGGESRRQLMQRGGAALDDILRTQVDVAAVVAHGGVLTAAFKHLLGIPAERSPFMLYNASISVIEFNGQVRLLELNRIDHLRTPDGALGTRMGDL
jgi:broad specificity phosphatase PhoE